ncbi:MAG: hypothetical protein GX185_05200 [Tissierellia bacterium]|nr:hypothetical protein [Tissierellia bacterium]
MIDLNFFEAYREKRSLKIDMVTVLLAILLVYVIFSVTYGIYNHMLISSKAKNVQALREVAENPRTLDKVNEIKEKKEEVDAFLDEVDRIREMDRLIEGRDIIDENLLTFLSSKKPKDLFFTNFSISSREIYINGIAKDSYSVAEFSKGLEEAERVDSIFVSNISWMEDHYSFSLIISLKEVVDHGEIGERD